MWRAMSSATSSANGPAGETIGQRRPFDQLHDDRVHAAGDFEAVDGGDVRMVQRGKQASFTLQPRDALGIARKRCWQHLDGHLAMEARVERAIHFAHATGIERPEDPVRSELDALGQRAHAVASVGGSASIAAPSANDPASACAASSDSTSSLERDVLAARLAQERRALLGCARQRRVKDLLDPRPSTASVRHDRPARPWVTRRYSQARADCHSRVIVARDSDRTAAISSSESPPKYFNSTMCA